MFRWRAGRKGSRQGWDCDQEGSGRLQVLSQIHGGEAGGSGWEVEEMADSVRGGSAVRAGEVLDCTDSGAVGPRFRCEGAKPRPFCGTQWLCKEQSFG